MTNTGTLYICKTHDTRSFEEDEPLKKHLKKKLARFDEEKKFSILNCTNSTLYYQASVYLASLIKQKGSRPLQEVNLGSTFNEYESMEPEEVA